MSEQFNILTLKPYRSGNLTILSDAQRENRFSSNLWGTKTQISLLKGRISKDSEGVAIKSPTRNIKGHNMSQYFYVFNLNQTNLKEESLNERRNQVEPFKKPRDFFKNKQMSDKSVVSE